MVIELERWHRESNYLGEDLSEYFMVFSKHRDSDYAAQSNFDSALKLLGGENPPKVIVAHFGHWAVGWIESIMVHQDAKKELEIARNIVNDIDRNSLLDWDHYYEIKREPVRNMIAEIKKDIANGNVKYWDCYGITENSSDGEIEEIAEDQVY